MRTVRRRPAVDRPARPLLTRRPNLEAMPQLASFECANCRLVAGETTVCALRTTEVTEVTDATDATDATIATSGRP
jgi:hypothetical protein